MATLRNKGKLTALNKENCEKHPWSNSAQNLNVPRSPEEYITQVSEEIEGRVSKKLFQEFSRTENRILGALSRFDDLFMNPLIQGHYGTAPETSRDAFSTNQGTNEDDSQSDPHPEAGIFHNQTTRNSGPEDGHENLRSNSSSFDCKWKLFPKLGPGQHLIGHLNSLEKQNSNAQGTLRCTSISIFMTGLFLPHYCISCS